MTKDFINPIIILIEDYPCDRKEQLLMRERHYIETMECVNKYRPIISREELRQHCKNFDKQYYENNKEELKRKSNENYQKNKEDRKEYNKNKAQEYRDKNKDYFKEYREKNKEELKRKQREIYQENKDEINRKQREKRAAAKELKNKSK